MFGFESDSLGNWLAFFAVALLVYAFVEFVLNFRGSSTRRIQRRLEDDLGLSSTTQDENGNVVRELDEESRSAMARWLAASSHGLSFRKLCYQAAVPWAPHQVLMGMAGAVIVVFAASVLLPLNMFTVLSLALVVVLTPLVTLVVLRNRRLKKFNHQLPEVLELLAQSLRAGHSLQAGFQLVAQQMPDPVGTEFGRMYSEQGLGIPLEEALDHLAQRIDVLDLRMFITAVHIQRQTGGDLTELMDKLSEVIRDRINILGQVKALTAEGRLSGHILIALPIVVLLLLLQINPDHGRVMLHTDQGVWMIGIAVVMQIIGTLMIRKIVNIKV